ncbi:hypothetical protein CBM2587_A10278 [Cupriavidus taiwanensis]|uniref:Uncharacterized protein n=1 Tax=Cupriavidus taiwanensis TaxID=164546 RepID=A0A375BCI8_9BURK|nr:hypothetical protein CBM2587_A10278 [Cupriavidus taiwanensis]
MQREHGRHQGECQWINISRNQ